MERIKKLMITQLDDKLSAFKKASSIIRPDKGWLYAVRSSINMTLNQLAAKTNTTPQNIRGIELREASGAISLNTLNEIAAAMGLKLVYALIPKEGSLEKLIEKRAFEMATQIVSRTSGSMKLEDQENTAERLEKAIKEKTNEIKDELPKYLWD